MSIRSQGDGGVTVEILSRGATIRSIKAPDKNGKVVTSPTGLMMSLDTKAMRINTSVARSVAFAIVLVVRLLNWMARLQAVCQRWQEHTARRWTAQL